MNNMSLQTLDYLQQVILSSMFWQTNVRKAQVLNTWLCLNNSHNFSLLQQLKKWLGSFWYIACTLRTQSLSHVWLFATPWTIARQARLYMGFPRQEKRLGFYARLQGIFLTQVSSSHLLSLLPWEASSLPLAPLEAQLGLNIYPQITQHKDELENKSLEGTENLRGNKHSSQTALICFPIISSRHSIFFALEKGRMRNRQN